MSGRLGPDELVALVRRVFAPTPADRAIAVLVDLPDPRRADDAAWAARRAMAAGWVTMLRERAGELGLGCDLFVYPHVGANNADLPAHVTRVAPEALPADAAGLDAGTAEPLADVLATHTIVLAPTEFSATAPLKVLARAHGFRAATLPGFSPAMLPALRLDYGEVRRRVRILKDRLDRADHAELEFVVDGLERCALTLDLRHRTAHASDGVLDTPGVAGNVPSGEAYIVPYEGERAGEPSRSQGVLPVQFDDEVVRFEVVDNRVRRVRGTGPRAAEQAAWLEREPAYGNLAELGLGVLAELGIRPVGEVLLDEKLGLHVALGRSDHFGGRVGPGAFSRPEAVVHIDHVYLPELQPRVHVARVDLVDADGTRLALMRDGAYGDLFTR